uniref:Exoribonuclease phosphorolytic domain-containing protein n=1 Tax=Psilocybe cubensis TaxID=181762 RepID=A0A8H7Y606_PSICU
MASDTRQDKRKHNEIREIRISYDGLARVDGSARFGFGDTAALASISGPIEVRLAAELPSKATFEVLVRPLSNVPATEAKSLAASIRSTLEPSLILTKNPRTLVQLVVQSLSPPRDALSLSAAMVNASSLALLKASSVPMKGVVAAVAVGQLSSGALVLDPSDEAEVVKGGGVFAFMFADGIGLNDSNTDCLWTSWKSTLGRYDEKELVAARELAREGAQEVYTAMRKSFEHSGEMGVNTNDEEDDDKMEI